MPLPSLPTLPQNNGVQGPQSGATPAPIHVARYARNGLLPHAVYETELGNSLAFAARIRRKNLFSWFVPIDDIPTSSSSTRVRWRFAAHTGPVLSKIKAYVLMTRQGDGLSSGGGDPSVSIYITNADESTTHGSATVTFGAASTSVSDTPSDFQWAEMTISGVPSDTTIYGRVDDTTRGRIIACTIYEEGLPIWDGNGYPQSQVAVTSPIEDKRRGDMLTFASTLWKRGAAQLWNYSVDLQSSPFTEAAGTSTNIIDATSTTVSAATPGATLDTRYCRTRSQATVPCVFAAHMSCSVGTGGDVDLYDSTGTVIASVSTTSTTPEWVTTTVDLPASLSKYDVHGVATGFGETISVYAFSLFQYA